MQANLTSLTPNTSTSEVRGRKLGRLLGLGLALLGATAGSAAADPAGDLTHTLYLYASTIPTLQQINTKPIDGPQTVDACRAAIKAAGLGGSVELTNSAFEKIPGAIQTKSGYALTVGKADAVCAEFGKWNGIARARLVINDAIRTLDWLELINIVTNDPANGPKLAEAAAACSSGVDKMIADGVPTEFEIEGHGLRSMRKVALSKVKATLCEPIAKAASTFAEDVKKAQREEYERTAAPYKAAGFTGDRLDLAVTESGYAKYGVGGRELVTPKELKAAKLWFEVLTGDTSVTVRRYEFRGDKLVGTTSRDYLVRPGAGAFR